jgi:hypothetical protein
MSATLAQPHPNRDLSAGIVMDFAAFRLSVSYAPIGHHRRICRRYRRSGYQPTRQKACGRPSGLFCTRFVGVIAVALTWLAKLLQNRMPKWRRRDGVRI